MSKRSPLLPSVLLLALLSVGLPAVAWIHVPSPAGERLALLTGPHAKQARAASAAEAARIAKRRHGGKILKVVTVRDAQGVRYRIKILKDDGRVITVIIRG